MIWFISTLGSKFIKTSSILSCNKTADRGLIGSNNKSLTLDPISGWKGFSNLFVSIKLRTDLFTASTSVNLATSLVAGFLVKFKFRSLYVLVDLVELFLL